MSQAQIEKKVADYLRKSQALEDYWRRPITAEQLQAEMDRMAQHTKQPEVLRELFVALGNDPFVIAECLARPMLAGRLTRTVGASANFGRLNPREARAESNVGGNNVRAAVNYTLPVIADDVHCTMIRGQATTTAKRPLPENFTRQSGPVVK